MGRDRKRITLQLNKRALAWIAGAFLFLPWVIFPAQSELTCAAQTPQPVRLTKTPERDLRLSRFTTYFDGNNSPRAHNIRLASKKLNGTKLSAGEEFSFNRTVGKRTKERGFRDAAVISEGRFVSGTGGGVCQVSTTLYNAAILAGMAVTEARSHSLQVGYVPPSLDAMVSSVSDLKFLNATPADIVIRMYADENSVTAEIYGKSTGYEYKTESVALCTIAPPPPRVVEGDEDCVLQKGKNGLKSESYLVYYRHGKRVKSVRLRRDTYAAVRGTEQKKRETPEPPQTDTPETDNSAEKNAQND